MLRGERMLPAHDMRPVEARVRAKLAGLQASMTSLGSVSLGPGHYALGRGYLALREFGAARQHLELAWAAGYHAPEVASALGTVHSEEFKGVFWQSIMLPEPEWRAILGQAEREHREPALAFFKLAQGSDMESRAMAQARIAYLEGRSADCLAAGQMAMAQEPWRYEALLLEASAMLQQAHFSLDHGQSILATRRLLNGEVMATLEKARNLARSDVEVARLRLSAFALAAIAESEGGRPTLEPFRQAEAVFTEALKIEPADRELWFQRRGNALREIFVRLASGEDGRDRCQRLLDQDRAFEAESPGQALAGGSDWIVEYWVLADAQWRRGQDPRPALAEVTGKVNATTSLDEMEARAILARFMAQRGEDPSPQTRRVEELLAVERTRQPRNYYPLTLAGEAQLNQATWAWLTGRDPMDAIRLGLERLDQAAVLQPGSVYPCFHLPLLHALEAQVLLVRGQEPGPALAAAVRTARRAIAIRPDHFRSHLGLAEALRVEGLAAQHRGEVPEASFRGSHEALATARRLNPTDWRLAWSEARLELAEACWAQGAGLSVLPALARADRAADRGLAVKGDAPELMWARAEAARLRVVEHLPPAGADSGATGDGEVA